MRKGRPWAHPTLPAGATTRLGLSRSATLPATMFRRRSRHRFLTALFAVLSLLFAQLALANYVCLGHADTTTMSAAADEPCDGMDTEQPVLCHQQAAGAVQPFEVLKVVSPSLPSIIKVLVVVPVVVTTGAVDLLRLGSAEARPPPDPLFLSTLRLRV
jgi:hypothetical protein